MAATVVCSVLLLAAGAGAGTSVDMRNGTWTVTLTTALKQPAHKTKQPAHKKKTVKPKKRTTRASALTLRGPTHNRFDTKFHYTVSGFSGAATELIAYEALPNVSCATTLAAEQHRSEIFAFLSTPVAAKKPFSHVIDFFARNHGTHWLCAYLSSPVTHTTFAHAAAHWTNS